jgi:predicted nucleic acid-binding protein
MIALDTNVLIYACEFVGALILPTASALDRAKSLHTQHHCSFWDAMIIAACLECGATRLYSEDLPGRASFESLVTVNPFT